MPGSSGTPSYVANPFAAAPGAQSAAYASALRGYTPNRFAGTGGGTTAMAPHLAQAPTLNADLLQAYRDIRAEPGANQGQQNIPDIDKLWRLSPTSPIFGQGFKHNQYVQGRANQLGQAREAFEGANARRVAQGQAPMTQEEYQNLMAQQQAESFGSTQF